MLCTGQLVKTMWQAVYTYIIYQPKIPKKIIDSAFMRHIEDSTSLDRGLELAILDAEKVVEPPREFDPRVLYRSLETYMIVPTAFKDEAAFPTQDFGGIFYRWLFGIRLVAFLLLSQHASAL